MQVWAFVGRALTKSRRFRRLDLTLYTTKPSPSLLMLLGYKVSTGAAVYQ